ncbi:MAG TPA: SRPBCC family protein [Planctomycetota bacterium]|nr:SRPBCC family protein [Planctomycetota bacterium]
MTSSPIDPDVARARTPDGGCYGAAAFAAQQQRLFPRTWHLAPIDRQAPEPGQVLPWTMLPGALDEPLLWTRADDGVVRCLSNVCTHRGNVLYDVAAARTVIRCGYHGRTFDLRGRMLQAPGFAGARDFPRREDDLAAASIGTWAGFQFAALQPAMPFAPWIAPVADLLSAVIQEPLPAAPTRRRDYEFAANWALYVDNFLEGLHIPYAHPALARTLALPEYRYETFAWGTLQIGVARPDEPALELPAAHRHAQLRVGGYYLWLFPCTMLNVYPWGLSVNIFEPLAPARTRVRYLAYVLRPELLGQGAGGALDTVELEDQGVVVATQRGVHARLYPRGRYSPEHEGGVHHFHQLLDRLAH